MFETSFHTLQSGQAGTFETCAILRALIEREAREELAQEVARGFEARSPQEFVECCFVAARDWIQFEDDPAPFEYTRGFAAQLHDGRGDCDDKVTFLATLLKARGFPVRFRLQSYDGMEFHHIYLETKIACLPIALDPAQDGHAGSRVGAVGDRQTPPAAGADLALEWF